MAADAARDASAPVVELEFRATEAELTEALCARSGRADPRATRQIPLLLGSTLLLVAAVTLPGPLHVLAFLAPVPFGALLGSLYDALRLRRRVSALDRWARAQEQYAVRVDDIGIHSRTAVSSSTLLWAAFTRCQETENLFVLSVDDTVAGMCVLPKRGVRSAGGVERLRELTHRHVRRAVSSGAGGWTPRARRYQGSPCMYGMAMRHGRIFWRRWDISECNGRPARLAFRRGADSSDPEDEQGAAPSGSVSRAASTSGAFAGD